MKTDALQAFLAQAVADAVGEPFEFGDPTRDQVQSFINSKVKLTITDDTQMALFGLEGLTWAMVNGAKTKPQFLKEIKSAYLRWFSTQCEFDSLAIPKKGLLAYPEMWHQRAPGSTCLASLRNHRQGKKSKPNESNGCGTVMRLLPFALFAEYNQQLAHDLAVDSSLYTHQGHEIIATTYKYFGWSKGREPMDKEKITEYGRGWTARSCLEMANWAFTNSTTYNDLLINAIAHPGDSDSVAAVAGSLWGMHGKSAPQELVDRLVEVPVITATVLAFQQALETYDSL